MAPKKGGKKMSKPEVILEMLIAAAEDFNSFMFTSPEEGINLDLEYEELLAEVTETADELEKSDIILAATAETLGLLDVEFEAAVADPEDVDQEESDESDEPDEPAPSGEEVDEEEANKQADIALIKKYKDVEKLKVIAKAWAIRIPPPFYKDVAKLKEYLLGKLDGSAPAPEKKAKADKSAKLPKEKKEGKPSTHTPAPGEKSNKRIVYDSFVSGTEEIEKLSTIVDGRVKSSTIKSWISSWKKGKGFPGGVAGNA